MYSSGVFRIGERGVQGQSLARGSGGRIPQMLKLFC